MGFKERLVKSFKIYAPEALKSETTETKSSKDFTGLVVKGDEVGKNSVESKAVGSRTSADKRRLEPLEEIEFRSNIEIFEEEAWQKVLGVRIDVEPFPKSVTPEVRKNLKQMGFGIRYIPKLNLGLNNNSKGKGIGEVYWYLKNLESKYPNWKLLESLSEKEKKDHTVPRNLEESYWEDVRHGRNHPPIITGQWIAVETVDKPKYGEKYKRTPFAEKLGFPDDRFNVSWDDVDNAIIREESRILRDIGLGNIGLPGNPGRIRLLEAVEWNLLGNREGWGKTDNTYEWTNEPPLIVGGGAGSVTKAESRLSRNKSTGFRAAIVLGS